MKTINRRVTAFINAIKEVELGSMSQAIQA